MSDYIWINCRNCNTKIWVLKARVGTKNGKKYCNRCEVKLNEREPTSEELEAEAIRELKQEGDGWIYV